MSEPATYPISILEFVKTHEPGREIETKGGFLAAMAVKGITRGTREDWLHRYNEFKETPV